MEKYTCKRCGNKFKQKQHLQNHINKQNKCISLEEKFSNIMNLKIEKKSIHDKGQYFTTNIFLKESVYKLILNNPINILEPSAGRGDLVDYVKSIKKNIEFDLYEIDENIKFLDSIDKDKINFGDFLEFNIVKKYDTIIGNPPYVKTKTGNLYIDFIEKCYELLNPDGELIFIVPSDFIKLTSSGKIINKMMENGTFTHIIHPNNEMLFENASVDVIIFRYCKNITLSRKIYLNGKEKYLNNTNGILTFSDSELKNMSMFSDYFDIYVGMVTGKENVFKNEKYGNIELRNDKNTKDKYILIDKFPSDNNELDKYMLSHKSELINRKIKKFSEKNWYEWGALRNYKSIENNLGKNCIYVSNITRSSEVCFDGKVEYFGGGLIIMIPKENISIDININIIKLVNFINSDLFKSNYMYSGRFKIGHKQLCNCLFDASNFI